MNKKLLLAISILQLTLVSCSVKKDDGWKFIRNCSSINVNNGSGQLVIRDFRDGQFNSYYTDDNGMTHILTPKYSISNVCFKVSLAESSKDTVHLDIIDWDCYVKEITLSYNINNMNGFTATVVYTPTFYYPHGYNKTCEYHMEWQLKSTDWYVIDKSNGSKVGLSK